MNWRTLKQPYPFNSDLKREIFSSTIFGLFIFLFLLIFQPFGLSNYQSGTKVWDLAGYGLVTTVSLLLLSRLTSGLFPDWYAQKSWTVGKNILYTLIVIFCIGLGNLLYSVWQGFLALDFKGFLIYQGITLLIGIFPVAISTLIVYHQRLSKYLGEAENLNSNLYKESKQNHKLVCIPSQNKSEELEIDIQGLLFVKAVENYVEVYWEESNQIQKEIIRNTLKKVEEVFDSFEFVEKCHRSYIINLRKVDHFTGNAQGLTLNFKEQFDIQVPVSRSLVNQIKEQLSKK